MKLRIYISTYPPIIEGCPSFMISAYAFSSQSMPGEERYTVDVEVPDRAEQLGTVVAVPIEGEQEEK